MAWFRRRRYDPRNDPYYDPYNRGGYDPYNRGRGRSGGSSCLRDTCLLETGCCVAEALDGNCLMLALPGLLAATLSGLRFTPHRPAAEKSAKTDEAPRRGAAGMLLSAITVYQRDVSAHRPACCRFEPSCSRYAAEAVDRHGATRGSLMAMARLLRCRPGGRRGADPVPA